MKFYDFEKLRILVEENPGKVISLGMAEDWFWTGVEVYDGEKFTVSPLSDGRTVELAGITGSRWATPVAEIIDPTNPGFDRVLTPCWFEV